jgi:hypothetical protein
MKHSICWWALIAVGWLLLPTLFAQESRGQVCIRAYEDRNGNAAEDAGEPLMTRGLSITLADSQGVIINSLLLEDSLRKSVGMGCFQNLPTGQYTLSVASADFRLTTTTTFITSIADTDMPTVFDVGGQVIATQLPAAPRSGGNAELTPALLEPLFFAGIGATLVVLLMIIVGSLIYFLFFRVPAPPRYATGSYAAVNPSTGAYPPLNPSGSGSFPPATPSPMRPIDPTTGKLRNTPPPATAFPVTEPDLPPFDDTNLPEAKADTEPPTPPPARPDSKPFNPLDDTSRFRPPQG